MAIDLLLNESPTQGVRRVGDIGGGVPHVNLFVDGSLIILQMPISITSGNQILWDQKDFTADSIRGAAALGAYENYSFKEIPYKQAFSEIGKGMMKDVASSVGSAAAGIEGLGDYILHKQGKAVNPNKEMTFNGIGYRSFSFEFELIPLNESQAQDIEDFIALFQEKAMPDYADKLKTYYRYPDSWDIELKHEGKTLYPQIMPCYLTDYSINYSGAGKTVMHKKFYAQTNINLTFTEAELHMKDKVKKYRG